MVIIKLKDILEQKQRTKYWLNKQTNINLHALSSLEKNQTTSIKFDTLEKICKALECTPNDLIEFE